MGWKEEDKQVVQSMYGGYCELCRELNMNAVPYHQFSKKEYERIIELKHRRHVYKEEKIRELFKDDVKSHQRVIDDLITEYIEYCIVQWRIRKPNISMWDLKDEFAKHKSS